MNIFQRFVTYFMNVFQSLFSSDYYGALAYFVLVCAVVLFLLFVTRKGKM